MEIEWFANYKQINWEKHWPIGSSVSAIATKNEIPINISTMNARMLHKYSKNSRKKAHRHVSSN